MMTVNHPLADTEDGQRVKNLGGGLRRIFLIDTEPVVNLTYIFAVVCFICMIVKKLALIDAEH